MVRDDYTFCKLLFEATQMPIRYRQEDTGEGAAFPPRLPDGTPLGAPPLPPSASALRDLDYFVSDSFAYYGVIHLPARGVRILVGPLFGTPATAEATVRAFCLEWGLSAQQRPAAAQFLAALPVISFARFLNTLAYLYYCFTEEYLDPVDYFQTNDTAPIQQLSGEHADLVYQARESRQVHNTWQFEQQMLHFVQEGDVEKLKQLLTHSAYLQAGRVAENTLRQEKNIFISLITIAARSAVSGGLDMEQAYQLSDLYIRDCEASASIQHVQALSYSALIDLTTRVGENRIPGGMSQEVFACIQFIQRHINEPMQVADVARAIGKSRSYLSRRFQEELGFDISSFIMRCRLEEAKSLLTYSDKTIGEISTYLCFSSQSYFQNVFKKKYGVTPRQYRLQHAKAR